MPFVNDSFTDVDSTNLISHTGETGATWVRNTIYGGSSVITGNRVRGNGSAAMTYASGLPVTAEYDIVAVIRQITQVTADLTGVVGRADTVANTGYFARYNVATGQWELVKIVAGTATSLGTFTDAFGNGLDRTLWLSVRDAAKKVFIDGVERISSTDNAITTAGRVAVQTRNSTASTGHHIDSIIATDALPACRPRVVSQALAASAH